jgi:sulfoxide reductase heme-binding subunit YedZ
MADGLRRGLTGGLGAQSHMTAELGTWGLRFLVAALAVAPLAALARQPRLLPYRREVGLLGFAYAAAHVAACFILGEMWTWPWSAWARRPDFIPGLAALLVLAPAALATFGPVRRRLGEPGWRRVQAWTLAAAPLTALHYAIPLEYWTWAPYAYGGAALALIGWRYWDRRRGTAAAGS